MLSKNNTGLVVVDIQGKLADIVVESELLKTHVAKLIEGAKVLGLPILWLEQNPEKLGATSPVLASLLAPLQPITKYTFNACDEPEFNKALKAHNKTHWLICGIEAHICVYQTAIAMQEQGLHVELVNDGISSRTVANKTLAIQKLLACGVGVTSVEMCLYELVKDCRAAEFKQILSLIR